MQNGDNYLKFIHLMLPERPWIDGQSVTGLHLLGCRCDCRSFAWQDSMPLLCCWQVLALSKSWWSSDLVHSWQLHMCMSVRPCSLIDLQGSCNRWNRKWFNSLTWSTTYKMHRCIRVFCAQSPRIIHFLHEKWDALWVLPQCWLYITFLQDSFTMLAL